MNPDSLRKWTEKYEESVGNSEMANVMYAHADAWQAEIDRLQAVITAMAEQESADNATLRELLLQCRSAIDQVPEKKVFGIGGRGSTHWYLADELVANIDAAITSQSEVKPWSRWRLC